MNRMERLLPLPAGKVFSYFDLAKGFIQIPIPEQDRY